MSQQSKLSSSLLFYRIMRFGLFCLPAHSVTAIFAKWQGEGHAKVFIDKKTREAIDVRVSGRVVQVEVHRRTIPAIVPVAANEDRQTLHDQPLFIWGRLPPYPPLLRDTKRRARQKMFETAGALTR